ncbi:MAG: carbon-nitrogen hydrolase [Clostridiales bacterium]|nr:carbon-nitrogen hydrolase [Clostridiales bacterium]
MKIALGQIESKFMDIAANELKMIDMVKKASKQEADIIVFPETFSTGYNFSYMKDRINELGEKTTKTTIPLACNLAQKYNIYVIIPIIYKQNEKLYNSAVIINNKGDVINIYHKNHLWDEEKNYFTYGNHDYQVYNSPFGKFGVIICYDVDFPETCRTLAMKGAEVIFVPSAWATTHRNLWNVFLPSRALENTVYIAGVNLVGDHGDLHFFGDSKVFDPTGELLITAGEDKEIVLYYDIDLTKIDSIRKDFPYLKERRAGIVTWPKST